MSGKRSRTKGHVAERLYADIFKDDFGFKNCMTTRLGSRGLDNVGIDLMGLPIHVQVKAGEHKGMNVRRVMHEYKELWTEENMEAFNFKELPFILIHHKLCTKKGQKRNPYMVLVHMSRKDFKKVFDTETRGSFEGLLVTRTKSWGKMLEKYGLDEMNYYNLKEIEKFAEYHDLVVMTFETFKQNYNPKKQDNVRDF